MAAPATQIPAPRVPFLDPQTNMVTPQWFLWFNNLYAFTGNGVGILAISNGGTGLGTAPANGQLLIGNGSGYSLNTLFASTGISIANGSGAISIANSGVLSNVAGTGITVSGATGNVTIAIDSTVATLNGNQTFSGTNTFSNAVTLNGQNKVGGTFGRGAPVTKTTDFTLASTENWVINNKSGSTCIATLPAALSWVGREVMFQNYQAQTLVSALSDVVPLGGGAAGTAILPATVGKWATLVSDGTNWIIMQAG